MAAVTCTWESRVPIALAHLVGRLDLSSAAELRSVLQKALADQPSAIVLEVSGLLVDDPSLLTLFSAFAGTATDWSGCPVVLCAPSVELASALDRLVISRGVPVHPTKAQALTAVSAAPAARRYRQPLPADSSAAPLARQVVAEACHAWGLTGLLGDAEVVVTELVDNAVRYAGTGLRLSVAHGRRYLHLSLRDGSRLEPVRRQPDPATGRGGRGLAVVDQVAASWGSAPRPDGKVVWATLRLPG